LGYVIIIAMKKTISWQENGREQLHLELEMDDKNIKAVSMQAKGCFDFLLVSQKMKKNLSGSIEYIEVPTGKDHSSLIWKEVILRLQGKWIEPVQQEELCHCRRVSTEKVDKAIVYGAHSLEDVRTTTSANTGCGTCKSDVIHLLDNRLNDKET
jgi:bacterioferritin-associated ferredoxin